MCYKSVYFAACEDINVYVPLEEGVDRRLEVCNEVSFRTGQAACAWDEETSLCETSLPFWFLPLMIASIILCLIGIAVYAHFHREEIEKYLDERARRLDEREKERERIRQRKLRRQGKL